MTKPRRPRAVVVENPTPPPGAFLTDLGYTPTEKQTLFHANPARYRLFGGAAGPGKSHATLLEHVMLCIAHPGWQAIILRRESSELEQSMIQRLLANIPGELYRFARDGSGGIATFNNREFSPNNTPSRLRFTHCQHEDDVYRFKCFHPDTEVLTSDGWVPVANVARGQVVATMDPATRTMEYAPVTETQSYQFDGDLISVYQKNGVSFAVTPNHTVWYSTQRSPTLQRARADELPFEFRVPRVAKWHGVTPGRMTFRSDTNAGRTVSFGSEDWAEFLGWYLAEGCVSPKGSWAIRLSQVNPRGRKAICDLLYRCGINFHRAKKEIQFNNKALVLYLMRLGADCYEKHFPRDVFTWDSKHLEILVRAFMDGDGHWYSKTRARGSTTSRQLADGLCEIAPKIGYVVTCQEREPVEGYSARTWHIGISSGQRGDTVIRKRSKVAYSGPVHCVTVPPHHTLLIRHGGRVSWSGNSDEFDSIGFDELTEFTFFQFTYMCSRLRATWEGHTVCVTGATNPDGVGLEWVRSLWIDREPCAEMDEGQANKFKKESDEYVFIGALVADNPHADPGYHDRLDALPEDQREALQLGRWHRKGSAYYYGDVWDKERHVVNALELDGRRIRAVELLGLQLWHPRWISIDYGWTHHYAAYWHAMMGPKVLTYREMTGTRTTPEALAAQVGLISRQAGETDAIKRVFMGPDSFAERYAEHTVAGLFGKAARPFGLPQPERAANDRSGGALLMHQLLQADAWMITDECPLLIKAIPSRQIDPDPKKERDVLKLNKGELEDCFESARYGVYSMLRSPKKPIEDQIAEKVTSTDPTIALGQMLKASYEIRAKRARLGRQRQPTNWGG